MAWNTKDVAVAGTSEQVTTQDANYFGFAARESSGTAACFFRIRAGGAAGTILERVQLSANESARECYVNPGFARGGLYVEFVSGAANVGVRFG